MDCLVMDMERYRVGSDLQPICQVVRWVGLYQFFMLMSLLHKDDMNVILQAKWFGAHGVSAHFGRVALRRKPKHYDQSYIYSSVHSTEVLRPEYETIVHYVRGRRMRI